MKKGEEEFSFLSLVNSQESHSHLFSFAVEHLLWVRYGSGTHWTAGNPVNHSGSMLWICHGWKRFICCCLSAKGAPLGQGENIWGAVGRLALWGMGWSRGQTGTDLCKGFICVDTQMLLFLKTILGTVSLERSGSFEVSQNHSRCHIPGCLTPLSLILSLSGQT